MVVDWDRVGLNSARLILRSKRERTVSKDDLQTIAATVAQMLGGNAAVTPAPAAPKAAKQNGKLSEQDSFVLNLIAKNSQPGKHGALAVKIHGFLKACKLDSRAILDDMENRGVISHIVVPGKDQKYHAILFPADKAPKFTPGPKVSETEAAAARKLFGK